MHGEGTFTFLNGEIKWGRWERGEFIGSLSQKLEHISSNSKKNERLIEKPVEHSKVRKQDIVSFKVMPGRTMILSSG
ncbi:MAG: hypothetical protein GX767_06025 [Firmicutes bacterium]|nr:hypothetical protein [Bacillota bacterium]